MLEIMLDTTPANKAIIFIESEISLNSINIIQVSILVSTTNFYIVDLFILFFLYLKNMDILSIYLNNIINQLIYQNSKNISIFCK